MRRIIRQVKREVRYEVSDELWSEPDMTRIFTENFDADFTIWPTAEIPNVGMVMTVLSNKSPEPTAVGACRSAVAVHGYGLRVAHARSLGGTAR